MAGSGMVDGEPFGQHRVQRVRPTVPVNLVKTYRISVPLETHWRPGTCVEVDCPHYIAGWRTTVDESSALGQMQAEYIRTQSGRRFTETRDEIGLTQFTFEAGQRCFDSDSHRVPLEREPLFIVRDGDWRGNPTGQRRVHANADDWVNDFGEHQDNIAEATNKG